MYTSIIAFVEVEWIATLLVDVYYFDKGTSYFNISVIVCSTGILIWFGIYSRRISRVFNKLVIPKEAETIQFKQVINFNSLIK